MMKTVLRFVRVLPFLLLCLPLLAQPYQSYDAQKLLTRAQNGRERLDVVYLDKMMDNFALHAAHYPPSFDTEADRRKAAADVQHLSSLLAILTEKPDAYIEIVARAAYLNHMGHNLDIPGAAQTADTLYRRWLAADADNAAAHFRYGVFLADTAQSNAALPYLQKALKLGDRRADFTLGLVYLTQGDTASALKHLQTYRKNFPQDAAAADLVDAIQNKRYEIKRVP